MNTLRIYLLGGLNMERNGRSLLPFPTRKVASLFAYLVIQRRLRHSRHTLAGSFWGDLPDERARRNLSDALWRLRQTVGQETILSDESGITFNQEIDHWLDIAAFEQSIVHHPRHPSPITRYPEKLANLGQAVKLYRGPFLDGYYDDWVLVERERLRELYLQALEGLVAGHKASGAFETALVYAQQLVASDSLREEARRELMRLYCRLDRPEAALRQYEQCRDTLTAELGFPPSASTTALYRQILAQTDSRPAAPPLVPASPGAAGRAPFDNLPLIGRAAERTTLLAEVEAALAGRGGLMLVEGESGIGKSRLIEEIARGAEWRGMSVLIGRCQEESRPYHPLLEALDQTLSPLRVNQLARLVDPTWLAEAGRILPALTGRPPDTPVPSSWPSEEAQAQLWQGIIHLLRGLSQIAPHIIVLEDIQWADEATLGLLAPLGRHLPSMRLLLLCTGRAGEMRDRPPVWNSCLELDKSQAAGRLTLERLPAAETGELIAQALGLRQPPPAFSQRIHRATAGNPFFVLETLKTLYEDVHDEHGDLVTPWDDATQDYLELPIPAGIRQAIQQRLNRLDEPGRAVVEAAAVLSPHLDFDLLANASGLADEAILAASDELLRRQFLVEEAAGYRFTHDLLRQVAYQEIPATQRPALHRAAVQALEASRPEAVEALARHAQRGALWKHALAYGRRAGDRARQVYAAQQAIDFYTLAIAAVGARQVGLKVSGQSEPLSDLPRPYLPRPYLPCPYLPCPYPEELWRAYRGRAEVWERMGQYQEAMTDYANLQASAEAAGAQLWVATALRSVGWLQANYQERWAEGLETLKRAAALSRQLDDRPGLAWALSWMGNITVQQGQSQQARVMLEEALALFRALDDRPGLAAALHFGGVASLFLNQLDSALAAFQESITLHQALGNQRGVTKSLACVGQTSIRLGDYALAGRSFEEALVISQNRGLKTTIPFALLGLGHVQWAQGDYLSAQKTLKNALQAERELDSAGYHQAMLLGNLALVHIGQGAYQEALTTAQETLALAQALEIPSQIFFGLNLLARTHYHLGQTEKANDLARQALSLNKKEGGSWSGTFRALSTLGLATTDQSEALSRLQEALQIAQRNGEPPFIAQASAELARAWLAAGHPRRALTAAQHARHLAEQMGARPVLVAAQRLEGKSLAALDRPEEARPALESALQAAHQLEAPPLLWETAASLGTFLLDRNEPEAARPHLETAVVTAHDLATRLEGAFRESFLARPAIRALFEQMGINPRSRRGQIALRRTRLLHLLEQASFQGAVLTQPDLAQALDVSLATIERDIAALRQEGRGARGG